jgi:hypothetical protein
MYRVLSAVELKDNIYGIGLIHQKRHLMRYVYHINRDALFDELFKKLAN